jgi:hypothetical protein
MHPLRWFRHACGMTAASPTRPSRHRPRLQLEAITPTHPPGPRRPQAWQALVLISVLFR